MSTIISLSEDRDGALAKATETLQAGSVVVLPVGGVYAIVADAFRTAATQRIFAARRRSRVTPLPVLLRSERTVLRRIVELGSRYLVPRDDGRVLVGATVEDVGFDARPTASAARDLIDLALRLCPVLSDSRVETT